MGFGRFTPKGRKAGLLVCDIGSHTIKMADFHRRGRQIALEAWATADVPPPQSQASADRQADLADALRRLVQHNGWSGRDVVCLASGPQIATHTFVMPSLNAREMLDALRLRLRDVLHFDTLEAGLAYRVGSVVDRQQTRRVTVAAAERDLMDRLRRVTDAAGLRMVGLTSTTAVLPALVGRLGDEAGEVVSAVLHLGASTTTLAIVRGGELLYARDLRLGGEQLTEAFMRPIIGGEWSLKLPRDQAESLKRRIGIPKADDQIELDKPVQGRHILPIIQPVLNKLLSEIRQSLQHVERQGEIPLPQVLFLSGGEGALIHLDELLHNRLGLPTVRLDFSDLLDSVPAGTDPSHLPLELAPAVGQALETSTDLDLLAGEYRLERFLDRVKNVGRLVLPIAAAVLLALYGLSASAVRQAQAELQARQTRLADLKDRLAQIQQLEQAAQSLEQCRQQIVKAAGRQPDYPGILKALSHIMPPDIVLTEMRFIPKDGRVQLELIGEVHLSGAEAQRVAATVPGILEASPFFTNTRPVTYDNAPADPGKDKGPHWPRFQAQCDLVY